MSKATQLSNSPHIIYNGYSSRMFGIQNVQPTNGLAEEIFIANTSLVTDQSRYNDRVFLLGVRREPLEFSMRLLFDPHTFDERKLQEMRRWLYQDTYRPFRYDSGQEQDLDIWVYAICTGESKVRHNAVNDAYIDFTFITNAPYRFTQVMEEEYDFSITNAEKMTERLDKGSFNTQEAMKVLSSRLKQSVRSTGTLSNIYIQEYLDLIPKLVDNVKSKILQVDEVYKELKKVKNASTTYETRWKKQRAELEKILSNVSISDSKINKSIWNKAGTNLYSKVLSSPNTRLELNGAVVYDNTYNTSEFIPVKPNQTFVWHTSSPVNSIDASRVIFYNSSREYLKGTPYSAGKKVDIVIPENTYYMRLSAPINNHKNDRWKLEEGTTPTTYTAHPFDLFPQLESQRLLTNIQEIGRIDEELDVLITDTKNYIKNFKDTINNTLNLYPDIVKLHNFGDLPAKPVIEIEVVEPSDIRIENLDTGESTTITDNIKGEVITLKNESEQIVTSRPNYYKYDSHDDNFITLREFENQLQFYGSFKVKIIYQFKIL